MGSSHLRTRKGGGATINSPDKEYNFKGRKSDDDSITLGDDSIMWENETMKIMQTFAEATTLEEAKAEAVAQEDAPVREILEWEFLAEKGDSNKALGILPAPPP
jgi:hypothetical protein